MPKRQVTITRYQCDGPRCEVVSDQLTFVKGNWMLVRMPKTNAPVYFHRVECAIAYLSAISNGFDAALIKAHIGEPRPAGEPAQP